MQLGFLLVVLSGTAAAQALRPAAEAAPLDPSRAADVVELDNPAFPTAPRDSARALTPLAEFLPTAASRPGLYP